MNVLLIGCGTGWGKKLLDTLVSQHHVIYSISSQKIEGVTNLNIDWNTLNQATIEKFFKNLPVIDFIFFNQNGSALSEKSFQQLETIQLWKLEKHWSQQYFNSVIFPFHILHSIELSKNSIVAWMLSSYIYNHENIEHADYIGNKYQNYVIMKNFSKTGISCCCGINPMNINDFDIAMEDFLHNLFVKNRKELNGNVIFFNGELDTSFETFTK